MAISAPHYRLFKSLKPILPHGGTLLEIGEANWYGDVDPRVLIADSDDPSVADRLTLAQELPRPHNLFAIAKLFYETVFAPSVLCAVDMNGTESALRYDLNQPFPTDDHDYENQSCPLNDPETFCNPATARLPCRCPKRSIGTFDVVINNGTCEHVFNIAQVFRSIHDATTVGGLMVHDVPFTGWIDHGFYCLQPTLFYDLAAINGYSLLFVAVASTSDKSIAFESRNDLYKLTADGKIPDNATLFVAMRKAEDSPFKIPMQGYYAKTLGKDGERAWETLR